MSFAGSSDILLSLIEPATDRPEQVVPIKLSGHAVFSHYAITPARGLHFGPVTYNTLSSPRFFEVMNTGEFPFTLKVFAMPSKQELAAATAASAEKAAAEETAAAAAKKGVRAAADKGELPMMGGGAACSKVTIQAAHAQPFALILCPSLRGCIWSPVHIWLASA